MTLSIVLILLVAMATIVLLIYAMGHSAKQHRKIVADKDNEIATLTQQLENCKLENKNLTDLLKKKEEIQHETESNIANIACSSSESSANNLQKPRKTRRSRSTSTSTES